jgi:hypothetical protein
VSSERRGGRLLARLLLIAGAVLSAAAMLAGWAQWSLLDSAQWSTTSQELIQRPEIRRRIATYVVSEVRRAAHGMLPSVLDQRLGSAVERELASTRVERVWVVAATQAHRELVRLIENDSGNVVVLDLRPVIRAVAGDIGVPVPALPSGVGRVSIVAGDQVRGAREAAARLKSTATVLLIVAPLTLLLAIAVARGWRMRALAGAGLSIAAAGAIVLLARALVGANVVAVLTQNPADRDAIEAAWAVGTTQLATIAYVAIAAGLALGLAAFAVGRPRARYL